MKRLIFVWAFVSILSLGLVHADSNSEFFITNVSPEEFSPSDLKLLNVTIKNIGSGSATGVTLETRINETSPIKIVGQSKQYFGYVGPRKEATLQFRLYVDEAAPKGIYEIPFLVSWKVEGLIPVQKPYGTEYTNKKSVMVNSWVRIVGSRNLAKLDVLNITMIPEVVKPGDTFDLGLTLKNVGGEPADSINVKLLPTPPFTPIGDDAETYLGSLDPDKTHDITFKINVDIAAPSRQYTMNFITIYESRNIRFRKNGSFGILVKGSPTIYIQEIILEPSKLEPDTEGLLMIRIINTGTERAEDVKIRIIGANNILTETYHFIGEVGINKVETASFGIYVDPSLKKGVYGLNIDITYKDRFENRYSTSKIQEVSIFPSDSILVYILAAAGVIGFSAIVFFGIATAKAWVRKR